MSQPSLPAAEHRHSPFRPHSGPVWASPGVPTPRNLGLRRRYSRCVPDEFDPQAMIERFRARASAVRARGIPPIEGAERQRYIEQAKVDFMDYAMLGDADAWIEDGVLTLRVDLRPRPEAKDS